MNPNMILPKNETVEYLLSKTKNCETPLKQTHRKPEDTLEIKLTKPKKPFHLNLLLILVLILIEWLD